MGCSLWAFGIYLRQCLGLFERWNFFNLWFTWRGVSMTKYVLASAQKAPFVITAQWKWFKFWQFAIKMCAPKLIEAIFVLPNNYVDICKLGFTCKSQSSFYNKYNEKLCQKHKAGVFLGIDSFFTKNLSPSGLGVLKMGLYFSPQGILHTKINFKI